jgi:uncharacterized protein
VATTVQIPIPTDQIAKFCARWHVVEFALFGSVLTEQFRVDSDVDVLVTLAPGATYTLGDLDTMETELESLFGRSVDMIDKQAVQESRNYLRRRAILESAQVIYQANYA